jgi:hypothetical protein
VIAILHVIFFIQRKKKLLEMHSFFGESLMPQSEIEIIKGGKNKAYRRMFIISVLTFLVVPIIAKTILKFIRRKG